MIADAARAATPPAPEPEKTAEAVQGAPASQTDDELSSARRGRSALRVGLSQTGLNVPQG